VKLISKAEADEAGNVNCFYELNGMPREAVVPDRSKAGGAAPARRKGDPADASQACAPMPGMVSEVSVSVGDKVEEGDKLMVLEAMKMLTSVGAGQAGTIKEILAAKGDAVSSDDLLVIIES